MYFLLIIIAIIVCVLLGAIVLIQNPKGGGLTSNFSSSSQLMGVQKTGDFLEKGTWILATAVVLLCVFSTVFIPKANSKKGNDFKATPTTTMPSVPTAPSQK